MISLVSVLIFSLRFCPKATLPLFSFTNKSFCYTSIYVCAHHMIDCLGIALLTLIFCTKVLWVLSKVYRRIFLNINSAIIVVYFKHNRV